MYSTMPLAPRAVCGGQGAMAAQSEAQQGNCADFHSFLTLKIDKDHNNVDTDLREIAGEILNWKDMTNELGVTRVEAYDIEESFKNNFKKQKTVFLQKWKQTHGFKATYGKLLSVLESHNQNEAIKKLLEAFRKKHCNSPIPDKYLAYLSGQQVGRQPGDVATIQTKAETSRLDQRTTIPTAGNPFLQAPTQTFQQTQSSASGQLDSQREEALNRGVSDKHIIDLAREIGISWATLSWRLDLSDRDRINILTQYTDQLDKQSYQCFSKWKNTKGNEATYKSLIEASNAIQNKLFAEKVEELATAHLA